MLLVEQTQLVAVDLYSLKPGRSPVLEKRLVNVRVILRSSSQGGHGAVLLWSEEGKEEINSFWLDYQQERTAFSSSTFPSS